MNRNLIIKPCRLVCVGAALAASFALAACGSSSTSDTGGTGNPDATTGGNPDATTGGNPDATTGGNPDAATAAPAKVSNGPALYFDKNMDGIVDTAMGQPGAMPIAGSTTQVLRFTDSLAVYDNIAGAPVGHVMTLWIGIFNVPEMCTGGDKSTPCMADPTKCAARCGPSDANNPGADVTTIYGGGGIVDAMGNISFGSMVKIGDTANAALGMGLKNPLTADVHLVIRDHGLSKQMGTMTSTVFAAQLTAFNGGCTGPCKNFSFAPHESVMSMRTAAIIKDYTGADDNIRKVYFFDQNMDGMFDCAAGQPGLMQVPNATSIVLRGTDSIDAVINIPSGANPGDVYTLWVGAYNAPTGCTMPCAAMVVNPPGFPRCGPGDVNVPGAMGSILHTYGWIVPMDGSIHLSGHLKVNDTTNAVSGNGITDLMHADIHLALRNHGALRTNSSTTASAQVSTFNGGCRTKCPNAYFSPHEAPH